MQDTSRMEFYRSCSCTFWEAAWSSVFPDCAEEIAYFLLMGKSHLSKQTVPSEWLQKLCGMRSIFSSGLRDWGNDLQYSLRKIFRSKETMHGWVLKSSSRSFTIVWIMGALCSCEDEESGIMGNCGQWWKWEEFTCFSGFTCCNFLYTRCSIDSFEERLQTDE